MNMDTKEHRQLLNRTIFKMALKTMALAFVLGVVLMIPAQLRFNTFSSTLQILGQTVIVLGVIYAVWIAWKKYRAITRSLQ